MFVLRIDVAAADAGSHIDEVQLDDAGDGPPMLLVETWAVARLLGQLQIDARG